MELTVLIPCLNEARTIGVCIDKANAFIERTGIAAEVVVSDNGSSDGSQSIAIRRGARVVLASERGYGAALIHGIQQARGKFIIMGDADDSYDFSRLDAYVDRLRAGAEVVVGNRFKGGIEPGAMPPLHRYLGNPVLSFIGRLFFRIPIGDFHCGLRGFSKDAVSKLGLTSPGMEFATEMIAKAARAGLSVVEVPTTLSRDGRDRPPHLRTWRDGWRHLLFMLLFSPRWLFLLPGLTLSAVGALLALLLLAGPVRLGSVGLDVHSLFYASGAVILGAQLLQFAVLTKWIGVLAGMLPEGRLVAALNRSASVEWGLVLGGIIFLVGLTWSGYLAGMWSDAGFGELDPRQKMRAVIPAVTMMILGLQACAGAMLAAAMGLAWKTVRAKRNEVQGNQS
jgi:glycosyltransferase involved in cell wall biosynthesis